MNLVWNLTQKKRKGIDDFLPFTGDPAKRKGGAVTDPADMQRVLESIGGGGQ